MFTERLDRKGEVKGFYLTLPLAYLWYQTDVNVAEVFSLHFKLELPEGLDERHALDVSNSSSQLQTCATATNI